MNSVSEVKRKKNESFEAFFRRVKLQWQRSGRPLQAKKIQYFEPKKSKNEQRKQAVDYAKKISKLNYLRKVGRLPADQDPLQKRK